MDAEAKPRKLRIITGTVEEVEFQLNQLLKDYALSTLNFAVVENKLRMTAILILASELRMQQLMAGGPGRPI
jgi:hypothetical protein